MKSNACPVVLFGQLSIRAALLAALSASGAIRYVDVNSAKPTPPYTSWATSAASIQEAVDAAVEGDQIVVTNGVYQTGARSAVSIRATLGTRNRVVVDKPLSIQSVNGPAVTLIDGSQLFRCVYLTNGAGLSGFTLTNGNAIDGGGVLSESANTVVSNCVMVGNVAGGFGGGADSGTLSDCMLMTNTAFEGGGAHDSVLKNCKVRSNLSFDNGGGIYGGLAINCILVDNSSNAGGGGAYGEGTDECALNNCALSGNSSAYGGGADGSTLNNCTITGNSAAGGGGTRSCHLNNCIVYFNTAEIAENYSMSDFDHSCTTPLPPGPGNISAEPALASGWNLSAGSPCRGAGSATYSSGLDIDGENWAIVPSIGCDEYHPKAVTGPLTASVKAAYMEVATGFAVSFSATVGGRAASNRWEFDDGTVLSNRLFVTHSWSTVGEHPVVFRVHNDTYPEGVSAAITIHVMAQPVHYVALDSLNPVPPYTSWATSATNIQDAVDATSLPGELVLVSYGTYDTGGRSLSENGPTNRLTVTKPIIVESLSLAAITVIQGGDSGVRCVYLGNGATLVGFTVKSGSDGNGGGIWCQSASAVVSNCVLTGNSGYLGGGAFGGTFYNCDFQQNSAFVGGGAYESTMYNCSFEGNRASGGGGASGGILNFCTLKRNSAGSGGGVSGSFDTQCNLNNCLLTSNSASSGGGASGCTLNNCTLSGNWATNSGGGVVSSTLNNCIVYYNSTPDATNGENYAESTFSYSCTTPIPEMGAGNFTNAPLFLDYGAGDFHPQSNSPCINSGANNFASSNQDLAGNARVVGGTVDMGAYEFQTPQSIISYAWLQRYGLATDGSVDQKDIDGDGASNWAEWLADTNPTNSLSALRLVSLAPATKGLTVSWQSVAGVNYALDRSTDLRAQSPFLPIATNLVGDPERTKFTDREVRGQGPFFYRIRLQQ